MGALQAAAPARLSHGPAEPWPGEAAAAKLAVPRPQPIRIMTQPAQPAADRPFRRILRSTAWALLVGVPIGFIRPCQRMGVPACFSPAALQDQAWDIATAFVSVALLAYWLQSRATRQAGSAETP